MEQLKIYFPSFGLAGKKALIKLNEIGWKKENILIHTHKHQDNDVFINYLDENKFKYYLDKKLSINDIKSFNPDYTVSIHYRDKIPKEVLNLCPGMNLHPSLLPQYAGCLSIMWQIINNESETGITYHYLTENFDRGRIILQAKTEIKKDETGESLFYKLIDLGINNLEEAINLMLDNYQGNAQVGEFEYYSRKIPNNGMINDEWEKDKIERFIRAFTFSGKEPAHILRNDKKQYIHSIEEYYKVMK